MDNNEQKQPRNPNDLLIMQNIDSEDHEWQYDTIRTPLPYFIRAGEVRELPFYIGKHGVETLIDKMLQREGKIHTSPVLRDELRRKIVLGVKQINYIRDLTPNEVELERLKRKKDADPYEEILKEREIAAEQKVAAQTPVVKPPLLETIGVATPQPITKPDEVTTDPVVTLPIEEVQANSQTDSEREIVYNLLRTKLHMDLTHEKTKEKLDSMPVPELKKEFSDQLPELLNPEAQITPDTREELTEPGMPVTPTQPAQPRPPIPAPIMPTPPTPQISMNPTSSAAPLLDQQLNQVK